MSSISGCGWQSLRSYDSRRQRERCKDQTVGEIRYHTSGYVDDQVCRDQNGQGAKRVLGVAGYMSTFVVGIWTQLKSLEATNEILLTKTREMPTSKNCKMLQETYYVP
jgi:hypothetical protein